MNADDRLSLNPLGWVEGGDGIVEGSHVADVYPQPTIPAPLDDLTQLGAIGYDDEVNSQAASGPRLGRAGDGHQRSSDANHARRPLRDVAAEDIEHQIDPADIFQGVVIEVDELLCAEVESRLTAGSAPGADDVRAGLTCELGRHRTDYAGCTVHEDALPRTKAAVLEQPLPRGQARHHEGRTHGEVNVARQRREVASLDGYILRQRAVASPVCEAEHPLSHRQPRRSIAEGGDHSGQLVAGDRRRPVTAEAVDPGRGPRQLIPGESRRMNLNNDIAVIRAREAGERRPLRLGPLHQLHPGRSRSLIRHHDRLHRSPPCVVKLGQRVPLSNLSRPPKCRSALSTIAAPVAGLEMSSARTRTLPELPPISAAADWSCASSVPPISTEAPCAIKRLAVSFPMPELPPVTIATLSLKCINLSFTPSLI